MELVIIRKITNKIDDVEGIIVALLDLYEYLRSAFEES